MYLFWRASARTTEDYVISLQLIDNDGRLVAQTDGQPLDGRYPTSHWQEDESIADSRSLTLPADAAPGAYELRVIVYRYPSLERLRVADSAGGDYAVAARLNLRQ